MLERSTLFRLYQEEKHSVAAIAGKLHCSQHKINYWLERYKIPKRSISEAIYQFHNPTGDPFLAVRPKTKQDIFLHGLGLGLYWGEGTKRGSGGVKLGNTDPKLIAVFIQFLERLYGVKMKDLKYGLQIFHDIDGDRAIQYWMRVLKAKRSQFYKVTISKVRGSGTYRYKSEYGVLSVYFHNTKLKKLICDAIDSLS